MTITISLYCILFFLLNAFFDDISGPIIKPAVYNFLFTLIEYIMFSILLSQGYNKNKKFIKIVIIFSILFICFHTIYFLSTEQGLIGSVPIGVYTVLIFAYIFIYFYLELRGDQTNGSLLISQPVFWVALGILVYLSGTFFFHLLIDYLPRKQIREYWFITYIFDIIKNILFTIAIFVHIRQANKKPQTQKTNEPFLNFL
jgi:hypothetical protein